MLREATYPPAAVNVLVDSSESMAAFQVFLYGRFWVFTEGFTRCTTAYGTSAKSTMGESEKPIESYGSQADASQTHDVCISPS